MRSISLAVIAACSLVSLPGCFSVPRGPAVPRELQDEAHIPGIPHARTWADDWSEDFITELMRAGRAEIETIPPERRGEPLPRVDFLAISGGGPDGAFGAGLLCGWTERGDRPVFKAVTGISTGALTAPFAFLGPDYDYVLREVYTQVRTEDILRPRWILKGIFSDALTDTAPLWDLVEKYVNQETLERLAAEYAKGRYLFIGTTNLDSRRGVIWNVGAIAASGDPKSLELLRSILIASAAIPAAFPPVMIDVEAEGEVYQELHVDGGAVAQVFLYPPGAKLVHRDRRFFVIRNSRIDAEWAETKRQTMSIAGRAISALIQSQGIGDLYKISTVAQRDGVDFNLAFIPPTFRESPAEEFDPVYMEKLFTLGRTMCLEGYPWSKTPPGAEDPGYRSIPGSPQQ